MQRAETPEIIECRLRLHASHPIVGTSREPTWTEWSTTVVGDPVTFCARVLTSECAWNGPLPPGAEVAAPRALEDPWWTVFLPDGKGAAVLSGRVGRPLAIGDTASSTGRCNGPAMMAGSPRADDRWRAQHARQRTQRAGT